jgi:hypothetical protein
MFLSEYMTARFEMRHGMRHERHGHDASMTAHDGSAVMAKGAGNQWDARRHDTMTLISSKWGDKGKKETVKQGEHGMRTKRGGRPYLTKTSVMPSWRVK